MTTLRTVNNDVKLCKLMLGAINVNNLTQTDAFDATGSAGWTPTAVTVTPNVALTPDGRGIFADELKETTAAATVHQLAQSPVNFNVSNPKQMSLWVKPSVGTRCVHIRFRNNSANRIIGAFFNLQTLVCTPDNFGSFEWFVQPTIQQCEDGWCHLAVGGLLNAGGTFENGAVRIALHNGVSDTYTGDGVSSVYIWRAQLGGYV